MERHCCNKNGESIDTSMGMNPIEGLMMGTRCGDIDPGIISYVMEKNTWVHKKFLRCLISFLVF